MLALTEEKVSVISGVALDGRNTPFHSAAASSVPFVRADPDAECGVRPRILDSRPSKGRPRGRPGGLPRAKRRHSLSGAGTFTTLEPLSRGPSWRPDCVGPACGCQKSSHTSYANLPGGPIQSTGGLCPRSLNSLEGGPSVMRYPEMNKVLVVLILVATSCSPFLGDRPAPRARGPCSGTIPVPGGNVPPISRLA